MVNFRDSAIKLFGKRISLQLDEGPAIQAVSVGSESSEEDGKDYESQNETSEPKEQVTQSSDSQGDCEAPKPENFKPNPTVTEDVRDVNSISEKQPEATSDSKSKALKKPDKILPCPRCKSMETKFCYYNNYNVNQPRHFCKHCQRYWTAGGSMRNVPVGAGRRKSKSSQFHQLTTYHLTAHAVNTKIPEPIPYSLKPNGSVLSFGTDDSILNHAEKSTKTLDTSSEGSNKSYSQTSVVAPCINGVPWPYSWAQIAAFPGPTFAVPLYPAAAYWTCAVPASASSVPSISRITSNSADNCSKGQEANSIAEIGKRSRNDIIQSAQESVPKTMRIGDPQEAVNSSIWSTVGHKNGKGVGLLRAFQVDMKNHAVKNSQFLHANPAALARSVCFKERL